MSYDGFAYVFNSPGYFEEAERSYRSLRRHMPDATVAYVTHPEFIRPERTDVIWVPFEERYDTPIIKVEVFSVPFERCIFLDGDTRVLRDCSEIFRALEKFDLALAHEPTRGWDYATTAPKPFCELNTGVLAFRKNAVTERFFADWKRTYDRMRAELRIFNDQPAFREALWHAEAVRLATLPSEYHLVTGKADGIAWDAHILHGRDDLDAIEAGLKAFVGPRAHTLDYGVLGPINGRKAALAALLRMVRRLLPRVLRAPRSSQHEAPNDWQIRAVEAMSNKT